MKLFLTCLCLVLPLLSLADETTLRVIGISHAERIADWERCVKTLPELTLVKLDADKATATLRYDVPALLGKPRPKPEEVTPQKIIERIEALIAKASVRTFSVTALTGIAEEKLKREELSVGLLDCKGCRYAVYAAVTKLPGFERATVDAGRRVLITWFDPAQVSKDTLIAALKKARVELPAH